MGIKAQAIPLEGPLEGGVEDAAVVVEPMVVGTAVFPWEMFERGRGRLAGIKALGLGTPRSKYSRVPIPAYLVRHPGAGAVLIDTGLHPSVATDPKQNLGRMFAKSYEVEQGHDLVSQLRARGVSPKDVRTVIMTHLHHDHASGISEFPDATFVISSAEWEAARHPRRWPPSYRTKHYDFGFDYRTVNFDGPDISSYGPLGRTFDLFGDGSVRLAFTPGHSPGHQSVVLRLPKRDFLVAGDVAYTWRQLEGGPEQFFSADRHNWRRSLKEVNAYRRAYPYAVVCPGHDAEFFEKLDQRYEA